MKIKFNPVNDLLLCEKVEVPDMINGVYIPDTDKWQRRGKVIECSPKLSPFADEYAKGEVFIYPNDAKVFNLRIDDRELFLIKKANVITKISEDE